jgi:hypothetical protein
MNIYRALLSISSQCRRPMGLSKGMSMVPGMGRRMVGVGEGWRRFRSRSFATRTKSPYKRCEALLPPDLTSLSQQELCKAASGALDERNIARASELMLHILDRREFVADEDAAVLHWTVCACIVFLMHMDYQALALRVMGACSSAGRVKEALTHYQKTKSRFIRLDQGSYEALLKV